MRRSDIVIVLLGLCVLWFVLVAYLATLGPEPRGVPRVNIGIVQTNESVLPGTFSLGDTNKLVLALQLNLPDESTSKTIYYIRGEDVDERGNATSWLYGVSSNNKTSLLIYDRAGWRVIPWNAPLPEHPIEIETVIPLGTVFEQNRQLLAPSPGMQRQVELLNSTYQITVTDGAATGLFTFDAINGALI